MRKCFVVFSRLKFMGLCWCGVCINMFADDALLTGIRRG